MINAEGEQQAAAKLLEPAQILATGPEAMQLRYLGTLGTIANERSSTIVFPSRSISGVCSASSSARRVAFTTGGCGG